MSRCVFGWFATYRLGYAGLIFPQAILKGNYENARQTMQSVPASTLRVLKLHQYWTICNDVMEMKGCLKRYMFETGLTLQALI